MFSAKLGRFINRDPWRSSWAKAFSDNVPDINLFSNHFSSQDLPTFLVQLLYNRQGMSLDVAYIPMPLDGFVDGGSLYSAYFSPNGLDPYGKEDSGSTADTCPVKTTQYCVFIIGFLDSSKTIGGIRPDATNEVKICLDCPSSGSGCANMAGATNKVKVTYDDGEVDSFTHPVQSLGNDCQDCPDGGAKGSMKNKTVIPKIIDPKKLLNDLNKKPPKPMIPDPYDHRPQPR